MALVSIVVGIIVVVVAAAALKAAAVVVGAGVGASVGAQVVVVAAWFILARSSTLRWRRTWICVSGSGIHILRASL